MCLLLSQDKMRELISVVDNLGGNSSHDNDSPDFDNLRDQLHHTPMVLWACNLLVYLSLYFIIHFINLCLSYLSKKKNKTCAYHFIISVFFVNILPLIFGAPNAGSTTNWGYAEICAA